MTAVHRPLSAWIARISPDSLELGPVNDGDDRSDARHLPYFADGWSRVAVPVGFGALGLKSADATVVELDDFGSPITLTSQGLQVIIEAEQHWPLIGDELADRIQLLGNESLPLRYWLLERLDAEGDPPEAVFGILPWDLLDRAVDSVVGGLEPGGVPGELVEIRHWLTPAVLGLTGPLEQLDQGLRTGESRIARLGAYALLAGIRDIPVSRIPEQSRTSLHRLVTQLGRLDPVYRHMSRVASARLVSRPADAGFRTELHSTLEPAASTDGVRQHVEILGDDVQRIRLLQSRAGRVQVVARIRPSTVVGPLGPQTTAFQPIQVKARDTAETQRLWIALYPDEQYLVGSLTIGLPRGQSSLIADDAPMSTDDLAQSDPVELVRSLQLSTARTADRWLEIAEELPNHHPVRLAANAYADQLGEAGPG